MSEHKEAAPVYLDYNATTPVHEAVTAAIVECLTHTWGNPSSAHAYGSPAAQAVAKARRSVAAAVGAASEHEIIFTSGGTEAINLCLQGIVYHAYKARVAADALPHVISCVTEHPAVLNVLKYLVTLGWCTTTLLPVDDCGRVTPEQVVAAVQPATVLVTLMHSNNEVGTLHPITEIVRQVKQAFPHQTLYFHTDTSQSIGKVPVNVVDMDVDFVTVAGHKLYAPKGIGAAYVRSTVPPLEPHLHGAGQEHGRRAGTENVAMIAGLGVACDLIVEHGAEYEAHFLEMRNLLEKILRTESPVPTHINGDPERRLPNTCSIAFLGIQAVQLLDLIEDELACSVGSACHAKDGPTMSPVLKAMGASSDVGLGTLRLSVGRTTTAADVRAAADAIFKGIRKLVAVRVPPTLEGPECVPTVRKYFEDTFLSQLVAKGVYCQNQSEAPEAMRRGNWPLVLVCDSTVLHPQGGGQPSDRGVIVLGEDVKVEDGTTVHLTKRTLVFHVAHVRAVGDVICHYGWATMCIGSVPIATPDAPPAGTQFCIKWPSFAGAAVTQVVDMAGRLFHAKLHSAGHLIDRAFGHCGYSFPPGAGYHFADGPFVEYRGAVPAGEIAALQTRLQAAIDELVAADVPTVVAMATPSSAVCAELGVRSDMLQGIAPEKIVRLVAVGGAGFGCPCGGTHVKSTSQLTGLTITKIRVKKGETKINYTVA